MIRWAGKDKFVVKDMNQCDFYDFNSVIQRKYKIMRNNTNGDKFLFQKAKWLRHVKYEKNIVSYKMSLKENDNFLKLDLSRGKVTCNDLSNAYDEELPITPKKKKDLISLLPEVFHQSFIITCN